jgi:glutamyl-tRNA synthetase
MTMPSSTTDNASAKPVRTRFAPSPTGFLHVGAFRTALFSWLLARKHGGVFILRIEDTDQNRLVSGSLESIIRSLKAMGMDYDEGPDHASVAALSEKYGTVAPDLLPDHGGDYGPYFQSQRLDRYNAVLEQLLEEGKAYYAFETEQELDAARAVAQARRVPFLYNRKFRDYPLGEARDRVAKGERAVIRFKMPIEGPIRTVDALRGETIWDAKTLDDFVIRKSDGFPPYHLAAIVDDHDMEISHVLRGDDWLPSFPKHVCLIQALGWEQPIWVHVPNVLGKDGKKKLSKRHGAKPLIGPVPEYEDGKPTGEQLQGMINQEGYLPEALVNFLALIGWSPGDNREVMTLPELRDAFSLNGISTSPGVFDIDKLNWMNGVYIRHLSREELAARSLPFLQEKGTVPATPTPEEMVYITEVVALEQEKYKRLDEVPETVEFFFTELPEYKTESVDKLLRRNPTAMTAFFTDLAAALRDEASWNTERIEAVCREIGQKHGLEKGDLTHPVRVAVSGREKGPGLFEMIATLGRERVLKRLARAGELAGG